VRIGNQHFAGSARRTRRWLAPDDASMCCPDTTESWTIAQTAIKILPFQLLMYYNASLPALRERAVGSAANTADSPNHNEKGPRHG
jgi:hypothetical protein